MGIFSKSIGPVFLKEESDISNFIEKMKSLSAEASPKIKEEIDKQIKLASYGEAGEKNIAYELKNSGLDMYILHTSVSEVDTIVNYVLHNKDKKIGIITPFVNQKKLIEEELEKKKVVGITCGTVHAFQGDEKDEILFSTAITKRTTSGTYAWLRNNKELINVATSRAKDKLVILADYDELARLHQEKEDDDMFDLIQYVKSEGKSTVTPKTTNSRALGIKPFSTETEEAFLQSLNHAIGNIMTNTHKYRVQKEVAISQVFENNPSYLDLFYTGRFDFVIYEKTGNSEYPILAIELDGKEHTDDEVVKARDRQKEAICEEHNLQLIRVENSYARRYYHIKEILIKYFAKK